MDKMIRGRRKISQCKTRKGKERKEGRCTCVEVVIRSFEVSEVLDVSDVLRLDFLFEQIFHVEEKDEGGAAEEGVVANALEQVQ
jgi:signal recognition particle subunit SEC65